MHDIFYGKSIEAERGCLEAAGYLHMWAEAGLTLSITCD